MQFFLMDFGFIITRNNALFFTVIKNTFVLVGESHVIQFLMGLFTIVSAGMERLGLKYKTPLNGSKEVYVK